MQSILEGKQTDKSGKLLESGTSKSLEISNFSFLPSRKLLKNYRGSISDVVVEDRKAY